MQAKTCTNLIFSSLGGVFIAIIISTLGCGIFTPGPATSAEETETIVATTPQPEEFLEGLLAIETARRNPGAESTQKLRSYYATLAPFKPKVTHNQAVNAVAFSGDGTWVVSGSDDGTARVWDVSTGEEIARTTVDGAVMDVDASSDGKWVAQAACEGFSEGIVACGRAVVRVWEASTGKELYQLKPDFAIRTVRLTPDSHRVVVTGNRGSIQLWGLDSNSMISAFHPDLAGAEVAGQAGSYIGTVDVDPTGRRIVASSVVAVQVWDLETGQELSKYPRGAASVAFSPDGEWVASAGDDIRIWEAETGVEVIARIPVEGGALSVDFSPDGQWLAVASRNMVKVWEISTGREVSEIPFTAGVRSVAFSPDGKWIASGEFDHTVSLSLWNPDDLIAEICALLPRNFTHNEWKQNFGDEAYRPTCPDLPVPNE